jgi:outer membrane protein assembly factor BamD (BamD/ComL family)
MRPAVSLLFGLLLAALSAPTQVEAARESKIRGEVGEGDFEASRLLDKANELLASGESERGVKMLETVIEQYPTSRIRHAARLALGRHYVASHDQLKAVAQLANLKALEGPDGEVPAADRETYLEGMYLMGTAYFQARNYGAAFPILRKITTHHANSVWANQAYYYIGMCHFVQQNWSKAIESLNLVGTFIDMDAPEASFVEAGRRCYVKVVDRDLSVLSRLGRQTWVELSSSHGDKEKIECIPLGADADVLIGSIATDVGPARASDNTLQVLGGDTITLRYVDANTREGKAGVERVAVMRVVSTATPGFSLGDFETPAAAAFLDQPLCVVLNDADLDTGDAADAVTVKLTARYKDEAEETAATGVIDLQKVLASAAESYRTRDEVTVRLAERGVPPVRSGRFAGKVLVRAARPDAPANPSDDVLTCAVDDEIVLTYEDDLHIGGTTPRLAQATTRVVGEIDNRPRASQDVVDDPVVRSRKNLVEASAYLELARIFKSMGLLKGARQKADEGLERVEYIIRTSSPIPSELKQQAFKTKWELHLAADQFDRAIATCSLFNRFFPDSPMVDEALMGIAAIRLEAKEYGEAVRVLRQILELPRSQVKAEAQFRIAEATEAQQAQAGQAGSRDAAIQQYKLCAERYPDSAFAGQSLAKLVDYHMELRDYVQANELLEHIFQDHPDASFLDAMLLKWVLVAYRSGDFAKARDKCAQLLFEYPGSPYAEKAKEVQPRLDAKLQAGAAEGRTP